MIFELFLELSAIAAMGRIMHTSRPAVDRLFDPDNASITLKTLANIANALGERYKTGIALTPKVESKSSYSSMLYHLEFIVHMLIRVFESVVFLVFVWQ